MADFNAAGMINNPASKSLVKALSKEGRFASQSPDNEQAAALFELITGKIKERLLQIPELRREAIQDLQGMFPGKDVMGKKFFKLLGEAEHPSYRIIKDLQNEVKALNRGLGELLTTDSKFFLEEGLFNNLLSQDLSSSALADTLKAFDSKMSGFRQAIKKVGHHRHLSSFRDLLINAQGDKKWVNTFLGLVEEGGYRIGDKGLTFIDPLAHKVFSTKDIAGKKFFNPKGILKEMGVKPFSATEQSIYSDLQNEIAKHFAHSNIFARGTRGYDLSTDLARFSPEDAYRIARPLLDIENVSALKGEQIDQLLEATKAKLDKGVYKTTEEAIIALTNQLKRLEIPNTDSLLDEYNNSLKVAISKQPLGFLSRKGLPTESILSVIPSGSGQLVKDSIKNIATKVDKVTDFIPGSKFAKRHGFTVLGLLGDTAKVLADEHQPKRVGTESEIGTTNYMRNQYAQAAVDLDRVSGWTGIASLAPGPQRWPLAGVSILTSFSADKARHQAATYKSDLDKVTDSLLPGTNPDDPGLDARFESKVNQGVYSHSEDNPVEIKEKDTNFIEELFWNVEKWKYGVK